MGRTQAVYYRDRYRRQPVREALLALPDAHRTAILRQIVNLNGHDAANPPPAFPATSHVSGGLRELRCHAGRHAYRLLYRRSGNLIVLLHVFPKAERAIPPAEIRIAERRWADLRDRMEPGRRGPRPLGGDAP
jgi:phage-related protein